MAAYQQGVAHMGPMSAGWRHIGWMAAYRLDGGISAGRRHIGWMAAY